MTRQQRRQQMRQEARYAAQMDQAPEVARLAAMYRNGITLADVERAGKEGFERGKRDVMKFLLRTVYAAILITMTEKHGWSGDETADLLGVLDRQVLICISDQELVEEAYEKTGVQLKYSDPIDRIQEV